EGVCLPFSKEEMTKEGSSYILCRPQVFQASSVNFCKGRNCEISHGISRGELVSSFWKMTNLHSTSDELKSLADFVSQHFKNHLIVQTSGSTGVAKWVALSHHSLIVSAQSVNNFLGITQEDSWLLALPTHHIAGLSILV